MLHDGFYNNILTNINPADIDRVTVLRNGTALYGAKGANRIILIDTRRSKSMATRITASLSAGVTLEPRYYDMMNASQYRTYASEMLKTTNTTIRDFNFWTILLQTIMRRNTTKTQIGKKRSTGRLSCRITVSMWKVEMKWHNTTCHWDIRELNPHWNKMIWTV